MADHVQQFADFVVGSWQAFDSFGVHEGVPQG
jgi:hypothetical protein